MWRMRVAQLLSFLVTLIGAAAVSASLPQADATRHQRSLDQALLFVPDPGSLRAAATGFEEPLANLFWLRTVLVFGERYDVEKGGQWVLWLRRMIGAVYTLDPKWRTAYFYGGTILRASGDIDGSDEVFAAGRENLPHDSFFPFSLGMNAYLYREDAARAAELLAEAGALPGAPTWYPAAAAAMRKNAGDRRAAILYLEGVRASTGDEGIRSDAERQLARLRHDDLVDRWADACRQRRDTTGPLTAPEQLAELGFELPENPRGDAWVIGSDGVVRSEGAEAERYRRALQAAWRVVGR
jgi:hypothetical protein